MAATTAPPRRHRPTAGPDAHPLGPAGWASAPVRAIEDAAEGKDPRHPWDRQGGMVPAPDVVPDGRLPTADLSPTGRPTGARREELRRPHDLRNVANLVSVWVQSFGLIALVCWLTPQLPLWAALPVWAVTFVLMGRAMSLFAILGHETAHRLLFSNKRVNDLVGGWGVAYPGFVPLAAYRRSHMAHHKDEFGPNEPDLGLYNGYPITAASMKRKLWRDLRGTSGWKNLKGLLGALRSPTARPFAVRILVAQVGVAAILVAIGGWERWWLYPLLWLAPWMTVWRVINRLRAIAEHAGLMRSDDRRLTTHVVRQTLWARFLFVPFNTGWHLAHHVDSGVPFQNLPRLHDDLVAAGWVTDELEYPSYRALWRALAARPDGAASTDVGPS